MLASVQVTCMPQHQLLIISRLISTTIPHLVPLISSATYIAAIDSVLHFHLSQQYQQLVMAGHTIGQ